MVATCLPPPTTSTIENKHMHAGFQWWLIVCHLHHLSTIENEHADARFQ